MKYMYIFYLFLIFSGEMKVHYSINSSARLNIESIILQLCMNKNSSKTCNKKACFSLYFNENKNVLKMFCEQSEYVKHKMFTNVYTLCN